VAAPEVPLATGTLVIADLHLDVTTVDGVASFASWLDHLDRTKGPARVPRLVILGDLFDVWVGPAQARLAGAPLVLDALQRLTREGTAIDLVPGNRDFLLERSFEARTGVRLHAEGFVGVGAASKTGTPTRTLFVHGDTLCTRDVGYQRLRRVLRSKPVSWLAPRMPLAIGTRVARRLRRASVRAVAAKLPDEKSIQRDAVVAAARAARCSVLVCGHAHTFRDETIGDPAGGEAGLGSSLRFVVVDAWGGPRDLLRLDEDGVLRPHSSASLTRAT
jgi:UDP-2,3-diacylglucosamine hydrolase